MDMLELFVLFLLCISSLLTLTGGFHESKDKRKRIFGQTPRFIVISGGFLTVIATILNEIKSNQDANRLEETIEENAKLSKKIDSTTSKNIELSSIIKNLGETNNSLAEKANTMAGINLVKADSLLKEAKYIAYSVTGGTSICVATFKSVHPKTYENVVFELNNIGEYSIKNLSIFVKDEYKDYGGSIPYENNVINIDNMPPGNATLNLIKDMRKSFRVLEFDTLKREYSFHIDFIAENGKWTQQVKLRYSKKFWHSATIVVKQKKIVYKKIDNGFPQVGFNKKVFSLLP